MPAGWWVVVLLLPLATGLRVRIALASGGVERSGVVVQQLGADDSSPASLELDLVPNDALFAPAYREYEWTGGSLSSRPDADATPRRCSYYRGTVIAPTVATAGSAFGTLSVSSYHGAVVAAHACTSSSAFSTSSSSSSSSAVVGQLEAFIHKEGQEPLLLQPAKEGVATHTLKPASTVFTEGECGVKDEGAHSSHGPVLHQHHHFRPFAAAAAAAAATARQGRDGEPPLSAEGEGGAEGGKVRPAQASSYIELLLVNDQMRRRERNGSPEVSAAALANIADALFSGNPLLPSVRVRLIGQVTFSDSDPYPVTKLSNGEAEANGLLTAFQHWAWRESLNAKLPAHDARVLISGYDFGGQTVGLAAVGSMCSRDMSGAIVQGFGLTDAQAGLTLTHELGHTVGMGHDNNPSRGCPPSGFIMASRMEFFGAAVTRFSPCSQDEFQEWFNRGTSACMLNEPTRQWGGICGDGIVGGEEECDCGSRTDPCCDCSTCKLQPGKQCSSLQPCCDASCQLVPAAERKVCRPAAHASCDVQEVCTGSSPECPADVFAAAGDPCRDAFGNTDGKCFHGECKSFVQSCSTINPSYGACAAPPAGVPSDKLCERMYCAIQSGGCAFVTSANTSYVEDGLPCGPGRQCRLGRCYTSSLLDISEVYYSLQPDNDLFGTSQLLVELAIGLGAAAVLVGGYLLWQRRKRAQAEAREADILRRQGLQMAVVPVGAAGAPAPGGGGAHRISVAPSHAQVAPAPRIRGASDFSAAPGTVALPPGQQQHPRSASVAVAVAAPRQPQPQPQQAKRPRGNSSGGHSDWSCPACTFRNSGLMRACEMCNTPR